MIVKILFRHYGSSAETAHQPIRAYREEDAPLLDVLCTRNANIDWDMPVTIHEYKVRDVEIPDWATAEDFCNVRFNINLKYYEGFGGQVSWGRRWFERLSDMDEALKYACIALLKVKNFRSEFRKHLREQLEAWLSDENPKYAMPFSTKQMMYFVTDRDRIAAKRCANGLYYAR